MPDVDQLTKDEAVIWKKMRWELENLRRAADLARPVDIRNSLFELERSFDAVAREAEQRREAKREASIEGVNACSFCLKKALPGKGICAQCVLEYQQRYIDNRIRWWKWFKNLWSPRGRMENAIFSYTRAAEKCRALQSPAAVDR